ncbi:hypothetical protein M0R45_027656 [Rubus argutus]|uniref:Uncharacterized protein n=1 Tax=Rubus argutus TaxID=59490 RepID=A0AAW1X0Y8_RUBAR
MEKEASTEEKITSFLSAEKLDRDAIAIQKEEEGEPSKDMKSLSISSGGPKELDSNKGQKNLADKVESNAEEENLDNDGKHLESKAQEETDKVFGEKKEPEPVFDGTEFPGMEAYRSMSIRSSDPDSETPGVVEKAVALTTLSRLRV